MILAQLFVTQSRFSSPQSTESFTYDERKYINSISEFVNTLYLNPSYPASYRQMFASQVSTQKQDQNEQLPLVAGYL